MKTGSRGKQLVWLYQEWKKGTPSQVRRSHSLVKMTTLQSWYLCPVLWYRSWPAEGRDGGLWRTTGAFRACFPRWVSRHNAGYFSLICKEGEKEEQERSGRVGEGRTETKALNLARCDIPEKNNTASFYCCWWRKKPLIEKCGQILPWILKFLKTALQFFSLP